ncbi:unnamed protein product, partial [Candidula unifasciata]
AIKQTPVVMRLQLLCLSVCFFASVHMQACPSESGWVMYDRKCYKFNAYPRLDHRRASTFCQENGATLLSINSQHEHQFIANWLQQNDLSRDSWLTSGVVATLGISWEGDGTATTSFDKWIIPAEQRITGRRVVYSYQGTEYGWKVGQTNSTYSYICEISVNEVYRIVQQHRDFNYGLDVDYPGQAPRGPTFLQEPQETVVLGQTDTVYLECLASGKPDPSYAWLVERQGGMVPLPANPRYSFSTGKLEIHNPITSDESTYQCKAANEYGTILSTSVPLSFGFLGEFSNVPPATVNGNEYDGAQLECPQIASRPAKSYTWYKDQFFIIRPDFQRHIFISASGKLFFSELAVSDQGTYYCLVTLTSYSQNSNSIGGTQTESRTSLGFGLVVKSGGASQFQPKIQNDFIYVFPPKPLKGDMVKLECFAYGTGELQYSWSRANNRQLPLGHKFESNNRILVLNSAQLEDGGQYVCKVFSLATNLVDERSLDLVIQSKPFFTYALTPQHVDVGSKLTWHCEATGHPLPTYQWYKNGKILRNSAGLTVSVNTLTIDAVDLKKDNGMYQCAATNLHGTTFSTAQLRVLELIPSFSKTPMMKSLMATLGGQVTIICNPVAAPAPTFKWFKDGSNLNLEPGLFKPEDHYKLLTNGNLIIQNITASDQGKYTCQAQNSVGQAEDFSHLKVVGRIVLSQSPSDQRVEVNLTATLFCQVSHPSNIDMIYLWKFNDHVIRYEIEQEYRLGVGTQRGSLYIIAAQFKNEGRYTCSATTGLDQISSTAYLTVIGPPGEPAGVYVDNRSPLPNDANRPTDQININTTRWVIWTDGEDRGSKITHYFVAFRTTLDPTWRVHPDGINIPNYSVTREQYPDKRFARLTNLKAGAGIEFRVSARNSFGIGPPSLPTAMTQISGAKPTVTVTNVRGGGGSVGELTVVWDPLPLEDHNGPDLKYKISWKVYESFTQANSSKWRVGEITHSNACKIKSDYVSLRGQAFLCSYVVLVGALQYYTPYEVKVQASNRFGDGPATNMTTIMSAEDMPLGAPDKVLADVYNATALMITWSPVPNTRESMKGKLKGYKINYWRSQRETEAQALQNIIELKPGQNNLDRGLIIGLEPVTWYKFNVQVYNSAGNGPKSSDYEQQTLNRVPSQYPTEVHVYSIEGFGVRVNFRGISTQIREEPLKGYKVQYWKSNENILSAREVDFGKTSTGVIRNLSSSELYELRVYGYSKGGQGKRSSPTVYFTVGDGQIQINTETTDILSDGPARNPSAFIVFIFAFVTLFLKL